MTDPGALEDPETVSESTAEADNSPMDRAAALRETLVSLLLLDETERSVSLQTALERVAPEDTASVLADFESSEIVAIFRALHDEETRAVVLEETDQQSRHEILEGLSEGERRTVLGEMPVDDLVDHLEELPADEQERLLATLDDEEVEEIRELQQYGPDTAGGMMTPDYVAVKATTTSGEALAMVQGNLNVEVIAYLYVLGEAGELEGIVSIRELLRARPETRLDEYMKRDIVRIAVDTDREEVGAIVDKYNLPVLPVVDAAGHMRGVVTFDDVIDAVQEEHSEDMLRMAGTTAIHPYYEPVWVGVFKRIPFLLVTMTGGLCVLAVQDRFRELIQSRQPGAGSALEAVGLFALVAPMLHLISGVSGNVSIVTSTIFVRGYATGEIGVGRVWRSIVREVCVGLLLALILSTLLALVLTTFKMSSYGYDMILVCAGGLCVSIVWAAVIGSSVPALCRISKVIDPAIASGPFVTISVDISASIIFLLFVYLFLGSWTPP